MSTENAVAVPEMSEARRRAEARKQRILAKGAERIAAAKGEGSLSEETIKSRPLAHRKAKELGIIRKVQPSGVSEPQVNDGEILSTDVEKVSTSGAAVDGTSNSSTTPIVRLVSTDLDARKQLEEEISRCTSEFDKQQIGGEEEVNDKSKGSKKNVDADKSTDDDSTPNNKTVEPSASLIVKPPRQFTRSHLSRLINLLLIILLGSVAGYYHARDTLVYKQTHSDEFEMVFQAPSDRNRGGLLASVTSYFTSSEDSRDRLLAFTQTHYAVESGSGGDSIRGIIDPVAAELAGGSVFSVLGVIRNPLIAVLLVWLLSSKIAALPIFDVFVGGASLVADAKGGGDSGSLKSSLVNNALQVLMGDYTLIIDGVLDGLGQLCVHIVVSIVVCAIVVHLYQNDRPAVDLTSSESSASQEL